MKNQAADFTFDGFTPTDLAVQELETGDVLIEGTAALYTQDLTDEAFEPGSLNRGFKAFMERNPVLLYHHRSGHALGQVLEYAFDKDRLRVRARVDKAAPGSWAEDVVNKIKRGTIRGLSVSGKFRRRLTEKGWRIYDADIRELSVSPTPIHAETTFAMVGAKAFEEGVEELTDELSPEELSPEDAKALDAIDGVLDSLDADLARVRAGIPSADN